MSVSKRPLVDVVSTSSLVGLDQLSFGKLAPVISAVIDALPPKVSSALPVTALFVPSAGQLSVFGQVGNDTITVSRNAAGRILVNDGVTTVVGGTPTVANTSLIQVFGQGGNDVITVNEVNGALPSA